MEVTIVSIIRQGGRNTRYLVKTEEGNWGSIKAMTGKYEKGNKYNITETIDCDEKWYRNYNNWKATKQKILQHLTKYKQEKLGIPEDGYWINQEGERIDYQHILPDEKILENLISSNYLSDMKKEFDKKEAFIHPGFKNLNSSQAFAFNFFQPIIRENLFYKLLHKDILKGKEIKYEYEKTNEEDTQFDFYIRCEEFAASFEVKYTEDSFGTADYDSHKDKWEKTYKDKVVKLLGKDCLTPEQFFENYQIWRNILFTLENNHHTYFIFPRFRDKDLTPVLLEILNEHEQLKERVSWLYVDDLVDEILKNEEYSADLKNHYQEFKVKYLDYE